MVIAKYARRFAKDRGAASTLPTHYQGVPPVRAASVGQSNFDGGVYFRSTASQELRARDGYAERVGTVVDGAQFGVLSAPGRDEIEGNTEW